MTLRQDRSSRAQQTPRRNPTRAEGRIIKVCAKLGWFIRATGRVVRR